MKRAALRIALMAVLLLSICAACRMAIRSTYTAYIYAPNIPHDQTPVIEMEAQGIITHGAPERVGSYLRVPIHPERPGDAWVELKDEDGEAQGLYLFRVGRFGTVYDTVTGGFTGDYVVLAAFTAFCLYVAWTMFSLYRQAKGPAFYAYTTIHAAGFGLFALVTGLVMLQVTIKHILDPRDYIMLDAYFSISTSGFRFMMLTSPFMLAFAVSMTVSNIELLRHEKFSPKNLLGIAIGLILVGGEAIAFWLYSRSFAGSEWEWRAHETLQNVYASAFSCFECILIGAIVCGVRAARHVPEHDADYILILGCLFRRDGTLSPLLQGRADRAIDYWNEQNARGGRRAVLMPSGGQGANEPMPEAEAIRRYLVSKGIPQDAIVVEDRSRNTYQNMAYSKELIDRAQPGARVVFSTTNYHVFRSGVWAANAGLPAEGMGSKTRWWYWPNAFMRECVGLLVRRIPQTIVLLCSMAAFFGALSLALS
ncbi:MAG: YdcF family protein [Clostridiales bacterium]|nr:YdcF family protein [Clostridiales bacterium]